MEPKDASSAQGTDGLRQPDTDAGEPGARANRAASDRTMERLRCLWEHRRFLARTTVWGMLMAAAFAFVLPKRYESTARLMPPDSPVGSTAVMLASMAGAAGSAGAVAGELLGLKSSGALFVGILRSRTVQDRLVERFDLKRVYSVARTEDARAELDEHTRVAEDRRSGIIAITVNDRDRQRAADLARAYVSELDRVVTKVSTSAARRERIFLEERLKVVKQELDEAARQFGDFASKNAAIDIKEQGRTMVEAAAVLQGQFIAAQTELEGLRQVYSDNNVRIRAMRARIAELRRQLAKLGGSQTAVNGNGAGSAELYPPIRKLPVLGVTYADLYRRTKVAETVYELLTRQYELARVQEAKETPTVKVLDQPVVPEKKAFPPRLLITALGTFLAASLAVVRVLASARWREMDPEDPAKRLGEDVLASVRAAWLWNANGFAWRDAARRARSGLRRWCGKVAE